ncbi:hypothetical protein PoB_002113700 [Plakobranchus ocellatus]|uniref:Uncharacterized protein n=1 Tax=Plakobranchus ocellatus TaxID=259542 RepID=A0AAV3ZJA9_9GAST|nr:hypothetical protein PoB_002113700 [Plakobranchus ocellatus]
MIYRENIDAHTCWIACESQKYRDHVILTLSRKNKIQLFQKQVPTLPTVKKRGVGGTVDSESALGSAGTLLSWVRDRPQATWPGGGPESRRSPCGLT